MNNHKNKFRRNHRFENLNKAQEGQQRCRVEVVKENREKAKAENPLEGFKMKGNKRRGLNRKDLIKVEGPD